MSEPHGGLPCPGCPICHDHKWQNGPVLTRSQVSASPCSTWDDHLWDDIIQVQTCECGATRRLLLGFKNQRRRGDDLRRADGRAPLGIPLDRSGMYRRPLLLDG